jgi:hypothetical protein
MFPPCLERYVDISEEQPDQAFACFCWFFPWIEMCVDVLEELPDNVFVCVCWFPSGLERYADVSEEPCSCFRLFLQVSCLAYPSTVKMEAICFSVALGSLRSMYRQRSKGHTLQLSVSLLVLLDEKRDPRICAGNQPHGKVRVGFAL